MPSSLEEQTRTLADGLADRLRQAQERMHRALAQEAGLESGADWRRALVPAAEQLIDALEAFLHDEAIWTFLGASELAIAVLDDRQKLQLGEIVHQDLSALLRHLGHRPPPPAETLEVELKEALAAALERPTGDAVRAMTVRRVEFRLAVFVYHLRRLLDAANAAPRGTAGDAEASTGQEWSRTSLRSALRKGAAVAVPAALAAATVAAVFPAAEAAQAAWLGLAAGAAGQELLKQLIQLGGTGLLDRVLGEATSPPDSRERFVGAAFATWTRLQELMSAVDNMASKPSAGQRVWAQVLRVQSISAIYRLLHAGLELAPGGQRALREAADDLLSSLDAARTLIESQGTSQQLLQLADKIEADTEALSKVTDRIWIGAVRERDGPGRPS